MVALRQAANVVASMRLVWWERTVCLVFVTTAHICAEAVGELANERGLPLGVARRERVVLCGRRIDDSHRFRLCTMCSVSLPVWPSVD